MRKAFITVSITVSSFLFCMSAHAGPQRVKPGKIDPAKTESVSKPAGEARGEAGRSFMGPSSSPSDRSWSSDRVMREARPLGPSTKSSKVEGVGSPKSNDSQVSV